MVGTDGLLEDKKQREWQERAVAKLEKLMSTWESPETGGGANAETGTMEGKMEAHRPREKFTPWEILDADYKEFLLQLLNKMNLVTERKKWS